MFSTTNDGSKKRVIGMDIFNEPNEKIYVDKEEGVQTTGMMDQVEVYKLT